MAQTPQPLPRVVMELTIVEDGTPVRLAVVARVDEAATRAAFAVLAAASVPSDEAKVPPAVVALRSKEHGVEQRVATSWQALVTELGRSKTRWVDRAVLERVSAACRVEPSVCEAAARFLLDEHGPIAALRAPLCEAPDGTVGASHFAPMLDLLRVHVRALASGGRMGEVERRRLRFLLGDLLTEERLAGLVRHERLGIEAVSRIFHGRAMDAAAIAIALLGRGEASGRLVRAMAAHGVEGHERVAASLAKAAAIDRI